MASIIVFYIVLIGLVTFLQIKVVMLRRGKIQLQTVHHDRERKIRIIKQTLKYLAHRLRIALQNGLLRFAAWRIRVSARIKRFVELRLPGLHTFMAKRPDFTEKHFKNFFWRGVVEYKYKMKMLKASIREEEAKKVLEQDEIIESPQFQAETPIAEIVVESLEKSVEENLIQIVPEAPVKRRGRPKKVV